MELSRRACHDAQPEELGDQLCWQRLKPMERLANILRRHLERILNYCRTKAPLGAVGAVNGNIKVLRRELANATSPTGSSKPHEWPPQEPNSSLS